MRGRSRPQLRSLTVAPPANSSFPETGAFLALLVGRPGRREQNARVVLLPYLVVHDGSGTKDTHVDIILLAHGREFFRALRPGRVLYLGERGFW